MFNELDTCDTCLSTGRELAPLESRVYQSVTSENSNVKTDKRICWECRAMLTKIQRFKLRAGRAQGWLQGAQTQDTMKFKIKPLSSLQISLKLGFDYEIIESSEDPPEVCCDEKVKIEKCDIDLTGNIDLLTERDISDDDDNGSVEGGKKEAIYVEINADKKPKVKKSKKKKRHRKILQMKNENDYEIVAKFENVELSPSQCTDCDPKFTQQSDYRQHLDSKHSQVSNNWKCRMSEPHCLDIKSKLSTYLCGMCSGTAPKDTFAHEGPKREIYQCKQCEKLLRCYKQGDCGQNMKLQLQLRSSHQCTDCGQKFAYKCNLKEHLRTHTGEKPFECSECKKRYTQLASLNRHKRSHLGDKRYKCSYCEQSFLERRSLTDHYNTHTGERPYLCSECGKCFTQRAALRTHSKIHMGVKPFECTVCNKKFKSRGGLNFHSKSHNQMNEYKEERENAE